MILWFVNDQPFFFKGRAGADGGRGEIGEVGAKVQEKKKKSVKITAMLFTQQLFSPFPSHARPHLPCFSF